NALDSLPPIPIPAHPEVDPDTLSPEQLDSLHTADSARYETRRAARRAERDSIAKGLKPKPIAACDTSKFVTTMTSHHGGKLPVAYVVPCDQSKLATSPDLPPSIYDPAEQIAGT